jgi:hypothetical protein
VQICFSERGWHSNKNWRKIAVLLVYSHPKGIPFGSKKELSMLETQEEVAELIRAAMRDLELDQRGHIEFHPLLPDPVSLTEGTHGPIVLEKAPRWVIDFTYPADNAEARNIQFQINTSDYQNLDEIRRFIATTIQP